MTVIITEQLTNKSSYQDNEQEFYIQKHLQWIKNSVPTQYPVENKENYFCLLKLIKTCSKLAVRHFLYSLHSYGQFFYCTFQ